MLQENMKIEELIRRSVDGLWIASSGIFQSND